MSSLLLEEPAARLEAEAGASQRLRATMAAVRLAFTWFGARKTLTAEQKEQAAESFGAEGAFLSAGKKLLDTRHAAYKTVTAVRGRIISHWRGVSLPYPEPGIRLIRQQDVEDFNQRLDGLRADPTKAVLEVLKKSLRELGLPGKVHATRHTFISNALMANGAETLVRRWVGHVDREIMDHYAHIADEASHAGMRQLNDYNRRQSGGLHRLLIVMIPNARHGLILPILPFWHARPAIAPARPHFYHPLLAVLYLQCSGRTARV